MRQVLRGLDPVTGWAAFWVFMAAAVWCSVRLEREKQRNAHEERMERIRWQGRPNKFDAPGD